MVDVKRRHRAGALGIAAVLATIIALPQLANADPIADKQAQANAIAAKIDQLNLTIEHNAEAANAASIELDNLNQQVADAQAKVADAQAQQAQHEAEIKDYAVNAYVHGADASTEALAIGNDPNDVGQRQGYLTAAAGNRQQLIDQLRASEEDLKIQVAQLNDAKNKAAAKAQDLQNQKAAANAALQEQQALYNQAQGELATLVKQAQEKQAADNAAAAQARAKAAAASGSGPKDISGPPPAVSGGAGAAIAEAQRQLGKPYVWGAAGPDSFDCSGLTQWAWRAGGVSLPHFSGAQYAATTHISMGSIQPGDLIFYESPDQHVALYVGGGQIIHAPHAGSVVKYDSLYYWNTSMMASRP